MENENQDGVEVLETTTTETETVETPTLSTDEIKALQEKAAKADELEAKNKQLFERVKKAEVKEPSKETGLSARDFLALKDANISADDLDVVKEFADFKKVPLADALKLPTLKTILSERAEERQTALAAQTKGAGSRTTKVTPESLIDSARKGKMPESDADLRAMTQAHVGGKK